MCIKSQSAASLFHSELRTALLARSAITDPEELDRTGRVFYQHKARPVLKQGKAVQSYHVLAHSLVHHLRNVSDGTWLEFGVAAGFSTNATCKAIRQRGLRGQWHVHGFDTFSGLPEAWRTSSGVVMDAGHFSQGGRLPQVEKPCGILHKGLLNTTLPAVVESLQRSGSNVAGLSIDVDLYAGSRQGLDLTFPLLKEGALLHFHELGRGRCCANKCGASECWPRSAVQDEARALHDFLRTKRPQALLALLPITGPPGQPEQAAAFKLVRTGT